MGVYELIQQKAFLGKEFMTWLWFRAERDKKVENARVGSIEIEVLGPILLDAEYGDARATTMKGDSPATSPEATTALLQGKKLKRGKWKFTREEVEWTLTIDGENFNIGGLSIPNPGRMGFEDLLTLRTDMIFDFDNVLEELFEDFMELRMDTKQWPEELEMIQRWVSEK